MKEYVAAVAVVKLSVVEGVEVMAHKLAGCLDWRRRDDDGCLFRFAGVAFAAVIASLENQRLSLAAELLHGWGTSRWRLGCNAVYLVVRTMDDAVAPVKAKETFARSWAQVFALGTAPAVT